MFTYTTTIKLHDTDAAGILFFSNQFKMMHDAYEALIDGWGFGFARLLREKKYFVPIVHAEADYKAPLFVGDCISIDVKIDRIGTTSFAFAYTLHDQFRKLVGTGKTVHVAVDKKTQNKIPLPDEILSVLKKYS